MNSDTLEGQHRENRIAHWDSLARLRDTRKGWGGYYRRRLTDVYRNLASPGLKILELGSALGNLLAGLQPSVGVGVDFSPEMISRAQKFHPNLRFIQSDVHDLELDQTFDIIILSDLINDLWDVQAVFERIHRYCHPRTRILLNFYSRLWEMPLRLAEKMGLAKPTLRQNWLDVADVNNLLHLSGMEAMRNWAEVLCPISVPIAAPLCNKFLVKLFPFRSLALTNFVVARPIGIPTAQSAPSVSVIVPARNEAGTISQLIDRVPQMGSSTEIIFVEGNSTDDTYAAIEKAIAERPNQAISLHKQNQRGKGDAVRCGFSAAQGDILMILDADLSVPPESLPMFYNALTSGKAEFANGVRLVYPLEEKAMRMINLAGNKFFGWAFSWLLGQRIKDTLCGTKVLWRQDYELLAANRAYFGDFDPFGDFDLLFGAARMNLRIVDVPVRYRQRIYGTTNINRWKHGMLLLRMTFFAARRLKFV